ncbi:MAG TPA: single-stranded-DNA-specific exonuclease RecJ [Candidatus Avacidaminococcus intestinavium]|uniref:Single-stranded-DNA-specific exonuclease RecJ n=1 Tax=Candidatus Avacidaminococcus intestinavium TaxID=2840684 RepID=A0A9D1MRC9_9FIRM|nr:single-stranded-DNA-specific exonuclease RecJ [Candidatus Avacidaminococcus intestinavium]
MIQKKIIFKNRKNDDLLESLAKECEISTIVAQILYDRGYRNAKAINTFLHGATEPFHDPYLMKDMDKAVERIMMALAQKEKITIYGDYDVDGITASSLLFLFLKQHGANVDVYIPERKNEGYGLNSEALRKIHANDTKLVITVDCGITGIQEVALLPDTLDMIITDHHTPPAVLPAAYAVVNPHQTDCKYPFEDLAGVGVAFKLCQALFQRLTKTEAYWEDFIELVAMGTVADIVPLIGENREIVKRGLARIKHTKNIGLQELIKTSGYMDKEITAGTIGFTLAPRLNAAGRIEHAMSAVDLLISVNHEEAQNIANKLNDENIKRQEISSSIFKEAEVMVKRKRGKRTALVLAKEDWHPGVIGIVASRLVDKHYLPSILISIDGEIGKGSCRSIPSLNLYAALQECEDLLIQFGGHHQAAGLTIARNKIEAFEERFTSVVDKMLQASDYVPVVEPDITITSEYCLNIKLLKELSLLEPFGAANPAPVFAFTEAKIKNTVAIGNDKNHLRVFINNGHTTYKGIAWNEGHSIPLFYENAPAIIAFLPKINVWNGSENIDLQIEAISSRYKIVDYRQIEYNKIKFLKNILQNSQKTVVYVNKDSKHLHKKQNDRFEVKSYANAGIEYEAKTVICYDLPEVDFFTKNNELAITALTQEVHLLYTYKDLRRQQKVFQYKYPGREELTEVYKELLNFIQQDRHCLWTGFQSAYPQPDLAGVALKIFEELGFIALEGERIVQRSNVKNDLNNSSIYRGLYEERLKRTKILRKNLETSLASII